MFKRLLDAYGHVVPLTLGPESYDRDIRYYRYYRYYRRGLHTTTIDDIVAWHWHNDILGRDIVTNRSITFIILPLQSRPHTKQEYDTEWGRGRRHSREWVVTPRSVGPTG